MGGRDSPRANRAEGAAPSWAQQLPLAAGEREGTQQQVLAGPAHRDTARGWLQHQGPSAPLRTTMGLWAEPPPQRGAQPG